MSDFVDPFSAEIEKAGQARWFKTGVVTAYATTITATIDGVSVDGIHRIAVSYPTPAVNDVALFAVVRGTRSVQYVAIGVIV